MSEKQSILDHDLSSDKFMKKSQVEELLNRKVDQTDFNQFLSSKTNKFDTQSMME